MNNTLEFQAYGYLNYTNKTVLRFKANSVIGVFLQPERKDAIGIYTKGTDSLIFVHNTAKAREQLEFEGLLKPGELNDSKTPN